MNWLTRIAVKKPLLTYLVTALIAGVSIWGTLSLKMELIPDIELPMTTIVTIYPGAQPQDVMDRVTVPVENAIAGMKGLRHVTSTSRENVSYVFAEFDYGVGMDRVNKAIIESLEKADLPAEVRAVTALRPELGQNPRVIPIDINMMPIVTFSLNGDLAAGELGRIAEEQIVPELKKVEGVFDATVSGGDGDKVLVRPSLEKLEQSSLSIGQLAGAVATQKYASVSDVENARLTLAGLTLKQVAEISVGPSPGATIHRTNGKQSVSIDVTKTAEANTVTTANSAIERAEQLQASLPAGVGIVTISDQSEYIERSIEDLTTNALVGGILAVLVVFAFLMAFRASLITAVSIPMSVLIGFLLMYFANITSNILTLSAMVLAIGRVIDDSIVIVEVTYRRMQAGEKFPHAAINGTREVATAVIASSVSTVIIFAPLAFVGGIVGEMFMPFALTITYAMAASLLSAMTIVPALSRWLVVKTLETETGKPVWYLRAYTPVLKWCLAHRALTLTIAAILFVGSLGLIPVVGTSFMPELSTNVMDVEIAMPKDAPPAALNEAVMKAEAILATHEQVQAFTSSIGSSGAGMFGGSSAVANVAHLTVLADPGVKGKDLAARLQNELQAVTDVGKVTAGAMQAMGSQSGSSLDISVRGNNTQDITSAAAQLQSRIAGIQGIGEMELTFGQVESRLVIEPDPGKMAAVGIAPTDLQRLLPEFLLMRQGGAVAKAEINSATYDVYLLPVAQPDTSLAAIQKLKVGTGKTVTLNDIANIRMGSATTVIERIDRKPAASLAAEVTVPDVGAVTAAVEKEIQALTLPPGVEMSIGGIAEQMQESFRRMYYSILIAIGLAYMVLVVTFRGFRNPLIIMVSLPLASVGALLGLLVSGHTLGVTGLMGVLMLVGIVLTNAVVLLAFVEQLRAGGLSVQDALIRGGQTRLRPILMTALVTLIAMLPLALGIGEGVLMAAELAVVVVGGLFTSTLLTLLVVPALYSLWHGKPRGI